MSKSRCALFATSSAAALALACICFRAVAAPAVGGTGPPAWSRLIPSSTQPVDEGSALHRIPGSTRSFTQKAIDDGADPPDWFPEEHSPAPRIVAHGSAPQVPGCALCHLYSGQGHPESANLAGQPMGYLLQQMADFKRGARIDPVKMSVIGKGTSDEDARLAAQWFSVLKPTVWFRVVEARRVPKTWITRDHLRLLRPEGGSELLGRRIVEVADNSELALDRDPKSGFTTYVPIGSIAKGRRLALNGADGRSVACANCHGPRLQGKGDIPRIAGLSAVYVAHQLAGFRGLARTGPLAAPMHAVAQKLTQDDILYLSAYLVSLEP